jgi:hypothetical protein
MCKLLAVLDIQKVDQAIKFANACIPGMTARDKDGLGVMRLGKRGVSIQRWLNPHSAPSRALKPDALAPYSDLVTPSYNEQGDIHQKPYAFAVHARYATCPVALENVHPFYRNGVALMHNGVISNTYEFETTLSSCDSEVLLTRYLEADVSSNLEKIGEAVAPIEGSFACIVFHQKGFVDIFKDDSTSLYIAAIPTVGTVFCTSNDILGEACEVLKIRRPSILPVTGYTAMRWIPDGKPQIVDIRRSVPVSDMDEHQGLLKGFDSLESVGSLDNDMAIQMAMESHTRKDEME